MVRNRLQKYHQELQTELKSLQAMNIEQINKTKAELNNTIALLQEKNIQLNKVFSLSDMLLRETLGFSVGIMP